MVKSTAAGGPRRPSARTLTTPPELDTSIEVREAGSAWTRTAFRSQVFTRISPL
jgi:hypothetical protein